MVKRPEALDAAAEVIGTYGGAAIHRSVTFKGMVSEFAEMVPRAPAAHQESGLTSRPVPVRYAPGLKSDVRSRLGDGAAPGRARTAAGLESRPQSEPSGVVRIAA